MIKLKSYGRHQTYGMIDLRAWSSDNDVAKGLAYARPGDLVHPVVDRNTWVIDRSIGLVVGISSGDHSDPAMWNTCIDVMWTLKHDDLTDVAD